MSNHDDVTRHASDDAESISESGHAMEHDSEQAGASPIPDDSGEPRYDVTGAALGALSREEEADLLRAAESDPALAAELAEMQAVASALARLAPPEQINRGRSAGMRSRLVTRAAASRAGRPVARQPVSAESAAPAPREHHISRPSQRVDSSSAAPASGSTPAPRQVAPMHPVPYEPRTGWSSGARAMGFLALAAAVAFAAVGVKLWRVEHGGQQDSGAVASRDSALTAQLAELRASVQSRDSLIATLTGQKTKVIDLVSYSSRDPMARMFWDQEKQRWTMYASHLKRPAPGYTYQLWLVARGHPAPISAGTFNPDTAGSAVMTATYALAPGSLTKIVVTEEPEGGVPFPTGQVAFSGVAN